SWKGLLNVDKDDEAIYRIYRRHIDAFNEDDLKYYLKKHLYEKIKGHNLRIIERTYYNAPTNSILNKARYINLKQRQRKFTSTMVDHFNLFCCEISPFVDNDFVDFILHVPVQLQVEHHLYKKMLSRHFQDVMRIGWSETGLPLSPNRFQAGLKWRMKKHSDFFKKITFGLYGRHDYKDYRHTANALRTKSREFMITTIRKYNLNHEFFNEESFNHLIRSFLNSRSNAYEKICFPLTFYTWSDVFQPG
ncbi:MAG: hypothetical protein SV375_05460, partial [Thermodesulfobacteriota bacterium]|nr:hypothetical protein [Thermodesulfobacteriota bacterium]